MIGSGNLSSAVRAQRIEPHDSLDWFPTPPWAPRALCEAMERRGWDLSSLLARDPACGTGDLGVGLEDYFRAVQLADVHDHRNSAHWHRLPGAGVPLCDFLIPSAWPDVGPVDWIVTNPPFRLATDFAKTALAHAKHGVALLVRTAFLEGVDRCDSLFLEHRPAFVLQFSERVIMAKGALRDPDLPYMRLNPKTGQREKALPSSATAYCWIVWLRQAATQTELDWLPACRRRLTKPYDYPLLAPEERVPDATGTLL